MSKYEFSGSEASSLFLAQSQAQMIHQIHNGEKEVKENELRLDKTWAGSSRLLYEAYNGTQFEGTDEEAAQYGLDQMSNQYAAFFNADTKWSEHDSKGLVEVMQSFEDWTPDQQLAFGYMYETYEAKEMSLPGFGRALRAMVQDVTNLATVGGPIALVAKWGGRQAAKTGFRLYLRKWMRNHLAAKGITIGAADGAIVMNYDDRKRQELEQGIAGTRPEWYPGNQPEEFSLGRNLMATGTGALFGAALATTAVGAGAVTATVKQVGKLGDELGFDLSKTDVQVPPQADIPATKGWSPKDLHSRMPTMAPRRKKNGHYVGAPNPRRGSPQARQGIIRRLFPRIDSALAMTDKSFTWYEDAGAAIDHMTRGDPNLKERMVRFLAIYSANADVKSNTAAALEAAFQHAKGDIPYTGKTPNQTAAQIENLLSVPEFDTRHLLVGNKIMNFYRNLHDPAFGRNDFDDAVTIDRHMLKMMGYTTKDPTDPQYAYAQDVIIEMTRKYNEKHETNLLPRQIQASLWTDQRNVSLMAEGRGIGYAGFAEELARATGHVTWEANTPIYPGFANLTPEEKIQFTKEARQLLLDEDGNDIILSKILQHPLYRHMAAAGSWEGVITPNTQSAILLPRMEGKTGGEFDPSLAELYASMMGYIYHQDAVPWFRFDPDLDVSAPNNNQGWAITISESEATPAFTEALYNHVRKQTGLQNIEFTRINLPKDQVAYSFINFIDPEDLRPGYQLSDVEFLDRMLIATKTFNAPQTLAGKVQYGQIVNEGELIFKGESNEGYTSKILSQGSSDLLDWGSSRRAAFEQLIESWKTHGPEIPPETL